MAGKQPGSRGSLRIQQATERSGDGERRDRQGNGRRKLRPTEAAAEAFHRKRDGASASLDWGWGWGKSVNAEGADAGADERWESAHKEVGSEARGPPPVGR